jgi:hypothetical protein
MTILLKGLVDIFVAGLAGVRTNVSGRTRRRLLGRFWFRRLLLGGFLLRRLLSRWFLPGGQRSGEE